jgi:hypothetical protein
MASALPSGALLVRTPYIDPKGYLTELNIEETAFNMNSKARRRPGKRCLPPRPSRFQRLQSTVG